MLKPHKNIARAIALLPLATMLLMATANAQECKNRGDLDAMYCDENKDLVADTPKAAKKKAAEAKQP